MSAAIWQQTETDGDRSVKRHAGELADEAARMVRDLTDLSTYAKDADATRLKRVRETTGTAERLRDQLEALKG